MLCKVCNTPMVLEDEVLICPKGCDFIATPQAKRITIDEVLRENESLKERIQQLKKDILDLQQCAPTDRWPRDGDTNSSNDKYRQDMGGVLS